MALIDQINIENSAGPGKKKIIFCQGPFVSHKESGHTL